MVENTVRKVTVDRISERGNPLAKETMNGKHIHVVGAEPGETVRVKLKRGRSGGFYVGMVAEPTVEQITNRRKQVIKKRMAKAKEQASIESKKQLGVAELGQKLLGSDFIEHLGPQRIDTHKPSGPVAGRDKKIRRGIAKKHD